jgi:ADP-ribose pyrophosphatase YjhB (NUDIX family)/GNAT superfamily N-acetyltransferase
VDGPLTLAISSTPDPSRAADISRARDAASERWAPRDSGTLAVTLRDPAGELVGGLVADVAFGWLHVELLWVDERRRGRGLGSRLLAAAEDRARELGCTRAYVSTLAWQAPDFYRRHGYRPFAEAPSFVAGQTRFWLAKALTEDAPGVPVTQRMRAAALVFRGDGLLVVEHRDHARGIAWWSPPGGGVEGSEPIAACAEREVWEESGLAVRAGRLAYVMDLLVPEYGRRNAEFFFVADDPGGEVRQELTADGNRNRVAFLSRAAMEHERVLPEFLTETVWEDRAAGFPSVRLIGPEMAGR